MRNGDDESTLLPGAPRADEVTLLPGGSAGPPEDPPAGGDTDVILVPSGTSPGADATFWPTALRARQAEVAVPERECPPDIWASGLRGGEQDHGDDDPLVFGPPKSAPKRRASSGEPRRSSQSEHSAPSEENKPDIWAAGLRRGMDCPEEDDPLVFGPPKLPRGRRNNSGEPRRPSRGPKAPEPVDEKVSMSEVPNHADQMVFSNPQFIKPKAKALKPPRSPLPGRPPLSPDQARSPIPSPATRMPDALRNKIDQRSAEQKLDQRGGSPKMRPISDRISAHERSKAAFARSDSSKSLEGDGMAADFRLQRRSSSQPPEPSVADQMPEKLKQRLQQHSVERPPKDRNGHNLPQLDQRDPSRRSFSQGPAEPAGHGSPVRHQKQMARARSVGAPNPASKAEEGGRQMFDKNELRSMHKIMFMAAIQRHREDLVSAALLEIAGAEAEPHTVEANSVVSVYLRKRPISEKEVQTNGDYDALTVVPRRPHASEVVLHNCAFKADLKTPVITNAHFRFDCVFGEDASNQEVYEQTAAPLVQVALQGGMATMFMFGQTGSGKTHTMTAVEEFAAQELFVGSPELDEPSVSIQFFELRGNRCFDLLPAALAAKSTRQAAKRANTATAPELKLRELKDGSFVADGAQSLQLATPEELCTLMRRAHACRATSATEANDVSSRSHAVCTLRLAGSRGQLLLIDCAGTERRKDAMYHSKERQQEGAEINASLHALKECIRYLTTQHSVPSHVFRASSLTKILAESFARGKDARLAVVCTASPCASDTEHTVSTLRTGVSLCTQGQEREEKHLILDGIQQKVRIPHPKTWTPDDVRSWLQEVADGAFRDVLDSLPSNFTGQMLVRVTPARCTQLCAGNQRRGKQLFDLLHAEMKRAG